MLEGPEECDDGNDEDGDGCSNDCQEEEQPTVGLSEDNPATSATHILAVNPPDQATDGLYWITNPSTGEAEQIECDMTGGGWMRLSKAGRRKFNFFVPGEQILRFH